MVGVGGHGWLGPAPGGRKSKHMTDGGSGQRATKSCVSGDYGASPVTEMKMEQAFLFSDSVSCL